jgi:hypothetical protein
LSLPHTDSSQRGTIAFVPVPLRRLLLITFAALAVLIVGAARGGASTAALPSLYVNYNMQCHFTMSLDSGAGVSAGSAIPYGTYQLVVSTPIPFSDGLGGCDFINFSMTGPGVNYSTQLGQGDGTQEVTTQTFAAGSSYTATDNTVAPGTTITFSASNTPVSGASSSSGSSSSSSSGSSKGSSGSQSPLGTAAGGSSSTSLKFVGNLTGSVSAAGKLTLTFKGKPVASLAQGQYKLKVTDKSTKSGFIVDGGGHKVTVTSPAYKGSKTVTLDVTTGQWYYAAKAGAAKIYFVATA